MSRFEISARVDGLLSSASLAFSTVSGDLSGCSRSPTEVVVSLCAMASFTYPLRGPILAHPMNRGGGRRVKVVARTRHLPGPCVLFGHSSRLTVRTPEGEWRWHR